MRLILFILAFVLAAAVDMTSTSVVSTGDVNLVLAGSEWKPISEGLYPETQFLRFGIDKLIHGFGGCNRFHGKYQVLPDSNQLQIGPLATSRKYCHETSRYETAFLQLLQQTYSFKRVHTKLSLFNASGQLILSLSQADWE